MIINDSLSRKKITEARTIDLGGGSKAYSYGGKYYIKKGDSKKEISADQYNKLRSKSTNANTDKSNINFKYNSSSVDTNKTDNVANIINSKNKTAFDILKNLSENGEVWSSYQDKDLDSISVKVNNPESFIKALKNKYGNSVESSMHQNTYTFTIKNDNDDGECTIDFYRNRDLSRPDDEFSGMVDVKNWRY